jgi:hypothetical protein
VELRRQHNQPRQGRSVIGHDGYHGQLDYKAGEGGCSVTVLEGTGGPWSLFATTRVQLRQSPGTWFVQTGQRWGIDSPEPEKAPNATLRSDGTLVLSAR